MITTLVKAVDESLGYLMPPSHLRPNRVTMPDPNAHYWHFLWTSGNANTLGVGVGHNWFKSSTIYLMLYQ